MELLFYAKLFLFPIRNGIFTYKVLCVDVGSVECEGGHCVQVAGDAGQMQGGLAILRKVVIML